MKYVDGRYVTDVKVTVDGEEHTLHVWQNPETKLLFAVDNMEVPAASSGVLDPYDKDVRVLFADTFTGLPK